MEQAWADASPELGVGFREGKVDRVAPRLKSVRGRARWWLGYREGSRVIDW